MIPGTLGGRMSNASPARDDSNVRAAIQGGVATASQAGTADGHQNDAFDITVDGPQDLTLTYDPEENSEHVYLRGIEARKGTDWTRTGRTLSLLAPLDVRDGDAIDVLYEYASGAPITPVTRMTYVGTANNDLSPTVPYPSELWGMSGRIAGTRTGGVWTYTSLDRDTLIDGGIADAYSVESTITSVPADTPVFFNWLACCMAMPDPLSGGIDLQTDNGDGMTIFLFRGVGNSGSPILSSANYTTPLVVGDNVKVVTDFDTGIATAYLNGASVLTLDFSSESWFFAGGTP
jgi:hypothetical protein